MNEEYELFVKLSLQTCLKEDYGDRKKRKVHNTAVEKLRKLQDKISLETLEKLLGHEDSRVKLYGGAACLEKHLSGTGRGGVAIRCGA